MKKIENNSRQIRFFNSDRNKRFNSVRKYSSSRKILNSTFKIGDLMRPIAEKSGLVLKWSLIASVGAGLFVLLAKIFKPFQWIINSFTSLFSSFTEVITTEN